MKRPSKAAREAATLLDQAQPETEWRMRPCADGAVFVVGNKGAVCKVLRAGEGRATAHLIAKCPRLIASLLRENARLRAKLEGGA